MQIEAKVTGKGQITIPLKIRQLLGIRPGDKLVFERDKRGVRVRPARLTSPFAKFTEASETPAFLPAAVPSIAGFATCAGDDHCC